MEKDYKTLMESMILELKQFESMELESAEAFLGRARIRTEMMNNGKEKVTTSNLASNFSDLAHADAAYSTAEFLSEFCKTWMQKIIDQ